jgi:hypothetical protein
MLGGCTNTAETLARVTIEVCLSQTKDHGRTGSPRRPGAYSHHGYASR